MASRAGSLSLVAGVLALDFANTSSGRDTAEPVEHLERAADLVDWAAHAGGIDGGTARRARAALGRDADLARTVLRRARELRDAVQDIGAAVARGEAPAPTDLDRLKDFARRAIAPAAFAPALGGGYALGFSAAPAETALLGPIAWSAVDLLRSGRFERVKRCPGPGCGWLFFDHSKNNSRRWCDMATCGNRTKGRRHRARRV